MPKRKRILSGILKRRERISSGTPKRREIILRGMPKAEKGDKFLVTKATQDKYIVSKIKEKEKVNKNGEATNKRTKN